MRISDAELREAVAAESEEAFAFLAALVGRRSTRGVEQAAQELVESTLVEIGFEVQRIPIPEAIGDDELAGVPALPYDGRFDVLGVTPQDGGRSLLINGHIDVVPANELTWSSDPYEAVVRDGWLYGRGAGDMKAGFAMVVLALRSLRRLGLSAGTRNLSFLSVIEEEYTGNGTLAAVRAGVTADAVLLPEPTNLKILLGGIAITWVKIMVHFGGGHAESSDRLASPALAVARMIEDFVKMEDDLNRSVETPFDSVARPYNINVGVIQLGEWSSSVPAVAELQVRIGHSDEVSETEILERVKALVTEVLRSAGEPRFEITLNGFRAESYYLSSENPFVHEVSAAHAAMHGELPITEVLGSTTDARYYVNQLGVPALCYGPTVRNMHGSDECVELASIEAGAATLARFFIDYFDDDKLTVEL